MRLSSPWEPRLSETKGAPSERLVLALADDILEGKLGTGQRLPPQRELADRLGIGLGTVTKAYAMLERRGLIRSERGRGSFVAHRQARLGSNVDLSVNRPPKMLSEPALARTLSAISRQVDPSLLTTYAPVAGHDEHRRQFAKWISEAGLDADPGQVVLCSSAQAALWVALSLACRPGQAFFTESVTYPGVLAIARLAGYRPLPVAMDGQGMRADALDQALGRRPKQSGRATVYLTPTLHNPTTATMGLARRQDILRVCRAHDALIIEDDIYSLGAETSLPPLAAFDPERTLYVNGVSKTLSPGLRVGTLVPPPAMVPEAEGIVDGLGAQAAPLSCVVMERWLIDGTADFVRVCIRAEANRRSALARATLDSIPLMTAGGAYHLWLPMARGAAERVHSACAGAGVLVTDPGALTVDGKAGASGIRLCLGAPSLEDLTASLIIVADILRRLSHGPAEPGAGFWGGDGRGSEKP